MPALSGLREDTVIQYRTSFLRSEDSYWDLNLSFHHVGLGIELGFVSLGGSCLPRATLLAPDSLPMAVWEKTPVSSLLVEPPGPPL